MYHKRWRKHHASVQALAESTSDSSDTDIQDSDPTTPPDNRDNEEQSEQLPTDLSSTYESDSDGVHCLSMSEGSVESGSDVEDQPVLSEQLATWATKNCITRSATNELLELLRQQGHGLPKDARTLLGTPQTTQVTEKCGGTYHYFGIESNIIQILNKNPDFVESNDCITMNVNIDGVPLFKSTNTQMWPILGQFGGFQPFIIALYCGEHKPNSVHEYMRDFLKEYEKLKQQGITFNAQNFTVDVRAFVCDAPARAFVKCTKNHNAYQGCERCTIHGSWDGRVVYNSTELSPMRNDDGFAAFEYPIHQVAISPLVDYHISCVTSFSLDYMHLVCLGVVKRMLAFLKKGPRECRLSSQMIRQISVNLELLQGKMPSEFARQPRSLEYLERWKATEFRQFVLYTGPIVLRNVVPGKVYDHFLTLTVALSILLNADTDQRENHLQYARDLMVYFVRKSEEIYGKTFTVYNVHNLLHIADDVEYFNCSLNEISSFPFENHLQKLKKMVRTAQNPVSQVVKRTKELQNSKSVAVRKQGNVSISTKTKDSCFLLPGEKFAFVKQKRPDGNILCNVVLQSDMDSFFNHPCCSKVFDIARVKHINRGKRVLLEVDDLCHKVACLPYKDSYVLLPLLHANERPVHV